MRLRSTRLTAIANAIRDKFYGAALNMRFDNTTSLDPRITFSRTTNATVTNSAGLVANAPMNLLTFSEQFDNGAWTKVSATVSANAVAAPNGTTTADFLTPSAASSLHAAAVAVGGSYQAGSTYTLSVYAKANGYDFISLGLHNGAISAGNEAIQNFNLATGTVASSFNTAPTSASITSVGNGWYRCVITWVISTTTPNIAFFVVNTDTNPRTSWTANGTSGIYVWGAQLELGSTATTYNPTTVKNLLGFTEHFDNAAWTKSNAFVQTNLLTYSQDFDNAAWSKLTGGTGVAPVVTANAATAPDGTVTADQVVFNRGAGTAASDISYLNTSPSSFTGTATASVWLKTTDGSTKTMSFRCGAPPAQQITVTGDWQRFTLTQVSATIDRVQILLYGNDGAQTVSVFIWGAQLVQGTSAGNYQATYAAAAAVGYTDIYGQPFAQKLVEDTANSTHRVFNSIAVTVPTTAPTTYTIYAKAAERTAVRITDNDIQGATFNLLTGAVSDIGANTTATATSVSNGWWRLSVTRTSSTGSGRIVAYLLSGSSDTYTGDGTSGIYIFGAQLSDSASVDPYVYQPVAAPSSVAYYGPRFDYDPVTLAPKGLLIEEQRTNLLLNSAVLNTQVVTTTATAHTLSFYGTGTIVLSGASTGTVVGTGAYPTRTTLTFTPIVGVLTVTVTGSVTMAQLEAGAFATSYTPTVASQVTRAADSASMIGNNFARWYTQGAGTVYVDSAQAAGGANTIAFISTGTNIIRLGGGRMDVFVAGTQVAALGSTTAGTVKHAGAYNTNDFALSVNSAAVTTDTSGAVPIVDSATFSSSVGGYANGTIKRIAYYNRRLSNTELQGITT